MQYLVILVNGQLQNFNNTLLARPPGSICKARLATRYGVRSALTESALWLAVTMWLRLTQGPHVTRRSCRLPGTLTKHTSAELEEY